MLQSERQLKHQRVVKLLDELNLDTVVLRKSPNTAWFSGSRVHVPNSLDSSCFDIVLSRDGYYFHTNNIEAPRLRAEELLVDDDLRSHPWWISRDLLLPKGKGVGSDIKEADREYIPQLDLLRMSVCPDEINRLDKIATDSAAALFLLAPKIKPTQTELQVAGLITSALWEHELETVFLGVAGIDRVNKFRHPLPTNSTIGTQLSVSICARRKGLIVSTTRIFSFEKISSERSQEYVRLLNVEAALLEHTQSGKLLSDAFKAGASEYANQGFASNEWHHHHQGGTTGYLPRELVANADAHIEILDNQAFAWNPTASGLKAESTWIANKFEVKQLGSDLNWPHISVANRLRPNILEIL